MPNEPHPPFVSNTPPKVSVAMVTYNHEKFIAQAIESVLMQKTDFPFELVIGEDCSTDGTRQIVLSYQKRFPEKFSLLLHDKNVGAQQNGKRTLQACRGEYIACLEGDDYWTDPWKLQKQVAFLESNHGYSGSAHQTQLLHEDGTPGELYGQFDRLDLGVVDTIVPWSPWHTSAFVFRRELLVVPDWYLRIVSADMAIFTIIASQGPIRFFPEVMSVYRKHGGGMTSTTEVISTFHHKRIEMMQYLDNYLNGQYHDRIQEIINSHRLAITSAKSNRLRQFPSRVRRKLRTLLRRRP